MYSVLASVLVSKMRFELIRLAATDFESVGSTVPPLGHTPAIDTLLVQEFSVLSSHQEGI